MIVGMLMVIIGMVLVVAGILLSAWREGRVEGGAVIVIGPIPIVIGSSPGIAKTLLLLGLALTVSVLILYIYLGRMHPG